MQSTRVAIDVLVVQQIEIATVGQCTRCARYLVTQNVWRGIKQAVRRQLGSLFSVKSARGLCPRCYGVLGRVGELPDQDTEPTYSEKIFIEEYSDLADQGNTEYGIRQILRMTEDDYNAAVKKAKRRGWIK